MKGINTICPIEKNVVKLLSGLQPLFLEDLPPDSQMSRFDRKFIFPGFYIPELIEKVLGFYKVLEINGKRLLEYKSQYFDTQEFRMYYDHHNGKGERFKIRIREYLESGDLYLEIKKKTNKGLMVKQRIPISDSNIQSDQARNMIRNLSPLNPEELSPSLFTDFKRFTLINNSGWERITMDLCLNVWRNGDKQSIPWLGVAEVKISDPHIRVRFEEILKERGIYSGNFSKYCTGMALLNKSIKSNNFKKTLLTIKNFKNEYSNYPEY